MSVHQQGALSTILLARKVMSSGKPSYLAKRLVPRSIGTRSGISVQLPSSGLTLTREGFIYRAIKLFNKLPEVIINEDKFEKFKRKVTDWVEVNIPVKP